MDTTNQLRRFTGWSHRALVRGSLEATRSHLPLDEEYWLALRHPAEVVDAGQALFAKVHPSFQSLANPDRDSVWREFRAYVRQAESFYRSAASLPWKSSPLNYYYAFMNLAKAVAVVQGALPVKVTSQPRKLRHGMTATVISGQTDRWCVKLQAADEILPTLYRLVIGTTVNQGLELDARSLLRYVSPIAWQCAKSNIGPRGWFLGHWIVVTSGPEYWDVLVLPKDIQVEELPEAFSQLYDEVPAEIAKNFAREVLDFHGVQTHAMRFFERKTPLAAPQPGVIDARAIEESLKAAAPFCFFDHQNGMDVHLGIGIPYTSSSGDLPMNEFIAMYVVMYFFSSLVRYHPDYLDTIGERNDAWLIESFVKSAPLQLLKYFVSAALGYTLMIESA